METVKMMSVNCYFYSSTDSFNFVLAIVLKIIKTILRYEDPY